MSATLQFQNGEVENVIFSVDTFSVKLSSYVTFIGHKITAGHRRWADPADRDDRLDRRDQVTIGPLVLTGQAENFEFLGNGSFVPLAGFGVVSGRGLGDGQLVHVAELAADPDHRARHPVAEGHPTDPADMLLTLSANVTGIQGMGGLTFSGSIQGVQIDVGLLLAGQFPIVGIASLGVSVAATCSAASSTPR